MPVLFFEAVASRRQIRRIYQRHRVRLHTMTAQQSFQQMLIDATQATHSDSLAKLVQHSHPGPMATQPTEAAPRRLFGQLRHHQIEGMGGSQQRQQMRPPQLRRTQLAPAATGKLTRTNLVNESVGNVRCHQFKQPMGPSRRERIGHQ